MAKPYDDITVQRAEILKTYRTMIRLKHSLAADREISETLPEIEAEINTALAEGRGLDFGVDFGWRVPR